MLVPKLIKSTLVAVVFYLPLASIGQEKEASTQLLPLQTAIAAALSNNKDIQLADLDEKIAASIYKQTDAIYLPQVDLSYTAMNTNNPLNAFGFKLQQKNITQNDFNPILLNNPGGTTDFMTRLEVKQPLVNMDLLYMRKAALQQINIYQFKKQRTNEYIILQVQQSYVQLQLAYQTIEVLQLALQNSKAIYTFTNNRFQQGILQKSDALNAQVHIAAIESNLADTKSSVKNISDNISLLMGKTPGTIYTIPMPLKTNRLMDSTDKIADSRADFAAMEQAIAASDLMIKSSKMSYLPKLNAFGSYQLNNNSIPGLGANAYLAGIQLSWNIFKGNAAKNKISTQYLERDKLSKQLSEQKEQSQIELDKTNRQLADAKFKIRQYEVAIEQANESLRILQNRYQQGLVNTTDVLMAETQLSQQKLGFAQTIFSYNTTVAYLEFLTTATKK